MTFPEIYFLMYHGNDKQWSLAMREVKRMKRQHPDVYACWREYVNRSIGG